MVENFVAELSELVYDTSISQESFMNSNKTNGRQNELVCNSTNTSSVFFIWYF